MFSFFRKDKTSAPSDEREDTTPTTENVDKNAVSPAAPEAAARPSWAERLRRGLARTRDNFGKQLAGLFGGGKIDEDLYEELEMALLTADVGVDATRHLLEQVRERVSLRGLKDASELREALREAMLQLIAPLEQSFNPSAHKPCVIMMCGVNGAGKTTSIGKLALYFQNQGKSVLMAAGDTFRAAAREQLIEWGARNGVAVISQDSADPAAVMYDAMSAARARQIDVVLADTAGRLPTQLHLMEEIRKVKRVLSKADAQAPHAVWLVIDGNTGQNAVQQVKAFNEALTLTGLIMTKLDGTAKGGVIAAIAKQCPVPLLYIGVGEQLEDLQPFRASEFIDALFD